MNAKLYISNLSYSSTEDSLKEAVSAVAEVESVRIITDRETGRSRGFGFVELKNADDLQKAIEALNGKDVDGREIRVAEAQERTDRPRGGNGGGNGGGYNRDRGNRDGGYTRSY
jgi:RNA recognition motif-containing protein